MRYIIIVLAVLMLAGVAQANPQFHTSQPIAGRTTTRWTFLTAWNLSTDGFEVSPSWYDGRYVWSHSATTLQQWIARFVYDATVNQTRELAWYYSQVHVQ